MRWIDRQERIERAKKLGRLAYRLMGAADICGVVTVDGQQKMLRQYACIRGRLKIDFYEAHRATSDSEFSRIVIRYDGHRVFDIRWTVARDFKIITFEPGHEWEEALEAESAANWF